MFPIRFPMDGDTPPTEPLVYLFIQSFIHVFCRSPQKGAPLTELPHRKMVPFWNPPNLLKFPVNKHPRFPNGSLRREASVSRAFFYTFPSKSLVNETPSMFPNRVPMEREASSPEPMVYSFIHSLIYMSESPVKSPPTKMGENIWSPSTEPHMDGRPTYNGVRPGSPGDC